MSTKRNQVSSFANRPWPLKSEDAPPLQWWRTLPSDKLRDAEKLLLLVTLERIEVFRGTAELRAAQNGDVAAAIAAALSVTPIQDFTTASRHYDDGIASLRCRRRQRGRVGVG